MNAQSKQCRWCKQIFPLTEFPEHPQMADGHLNKCKGCQSAANKAIYERKREVIKARVKVYAAANADKLNARKRDYYRDNRAELRLKMNAYAARPEVKKRQKAYRREYYLANQKTFIEKSRAHRKSEKGKAELRIAHVKEKLLHRHKIVSRRRVAKAVASGRLVKAECCQRCRAVTCLEGHHHKGYSPENWLEVRWLCLPCHKIEDREQEES